MDDNSRLDSSKLLNDLLDGEITIQMSWIWRSPQMKLIEHVFVQAYENEVRPAYYNKKQFDTIQEVFWWHGEEYQTSIFKTEKHIVSYFFRFALCQREPFLLYEIVCCQEIKMFYIIVPDALNNIIFNNIWVYFL